MLRIDGWINKTAKVPTITELLLDRGMLTVRDTSLKKNNKTRCLWQKLPVGGESAFFTQVVRKISGEKGPVMWILWKSQHMELLGQDRTGKWFSKTQGSCGEKATRRRRTSGNGSVRVGRGSGLMGLCRPWYQLGFYSELGEKIVRKRRAKMKIQKNRTVLLVWYEMNITYFKSSEWLWGKDQFISTFHVRKWQA